MDNTLQEILTLVEKGTVELALRGTARSWRGKGQ